MTNEQLQEIEQRWVKWINPKSAPKTLGGDMLILIAEVRRQERMIKTACNLLGMDSMFSEDAWRKYLESEVANNG